MLQIQGASAIKTRPIRGWAMQFKYQESREETIRLVRSLEARMGVRISCANDQGALFCHLELDGTRSQILRDGDWVVVDMFKRVSFVSADDFKVYYEPQ